jgi:hypothetical protein
MEGIHPSFQAPIYGLGLALKRRIEDMAAGDCFIARGRGYRDIESDGAIAHRTGEPGRAGVDIAGLLGQSVVFCREPCVRAASSDSAALRRARGGGRPDGGA